ncbi:MAG: hypothetical protein IPK65_07550 [Gammaproteobacteria bacterium]|nr:hypothetical protein [Gammaproteobacteria bacterium]
MNQKSEAIPTTDPDRKALRSYGLLMGGVIVILFGLLLPWLFDGAFRAWPWIIGGAFALLALATPILRRPIYKL